MIIHTLIKYHSQITLAFIGQNYSQTQLNHYHESHMYINTNTLHIFFIQYLQIIVTIMTHQIIIC